MDDQRAVNEAAVAAVRDFIGGPRPNGDDWTFDLGEHLSSNWGAVYGGATAAAVVTLARLAAPESSPRGLHLQMVRSLPCGAASGIARIRHGGRVVTTIEVELFDSRQKLAAVGLVTSVRPGALAQEYSNCEAPPFELRDEEPRAWDLDSGYSGTQAPIVSEIKINQNRIAVTNIPRGVTGDPALGLRIESPWDDVATTGPELACLIADAANGPTISYALDRLGPVAFPNTDLTLRFASAVGADTVWASGTLVAIAQGTTTVSIDVQAEGRWLAHGLSTSVLLPTTTTVTEAGP
jgi:hypothetical protein